MDEVQTNLLIDVICKGKKLENCQEVHHPECNLPLNPWVGANFLALTDVMVG